MAEIRLIRGDVAGAQEHCSNLLNEYGSAAEESLRTIVRQGIWVNLRSLAALREQGKNELTVAAATIEFIDKVIGQIGNSTDPKDQLITAELLVRKGFHLVGVDRSTALGIWEHVWDRYEGSGRPDLEAEAAVALNNMGITLQEMGAEQDAGGVFRRVIERFSDSPDDRIKCEVAKANIHEGILFYDGAGSPAQAFHACKLAEDALHSVSPNLSLQLWIECLAWQVTILQRLHNWQESLVTIDRQLSRSRVLTLPPVRAWSAQALLQKAVALLALGRIDEAHKVAREVIGTYAPSEDPRLKSTLESARQLLRDNDTGQSS
jgi:tetratricopeptide (TPR) repeat protein